MAKTKENYSFVLCIENKDCQDLERRKVYQALPDEEAEREGFIRVIDESGEDYLYPRSYFIDIQLPREAQEALQLSE
ncbi:MAG: hypothetical protein FJ128_06165 [Deltaproteobacteria bacterium]|nr:hypothetical protein [Deltaproteobacteria bacterium]